MFGALILGTLALGQATATAFTPLEAAATIAAITPLAPLTAEAAFVGSATVAIGSTVSLAATGPLVGDTAIGVVITAPLALFGPLKATAALQVSVADLAIIVTGPLLGSATIPVIAATAPLSLGSVPLAGAATCSVLTGATLRSLPATFAAAATASVIAQGDLIKEGFSFSDVVIAFNGAVRPEDVRLGSLTISDELNEAPNTCDFIVDRNPPAVGTDVRIGLSDLSPANLLFGGEVVKVTQTFSGRPSHPAWVVNCRDYTFLINRRKVWGSWDGVSATAVALEIIQTCTSGFSTSGIVAGLPAISVEFDGTEVMAALAKIASLVGGYCDVSPTKVVQLFITPPVPVLTLTASDPAFKMTPAIGIARDLSQVRTQVKVQGVGKTVIGISGMRLPTSSANLPISDTEPFGTGSGQAITDDQQILSYASTTPGNVAAKVGNTAAPPGSVIAQLAPAAVGGLLGTYRWAVAFANAAGETPISNPSNVLTCPDRTAPTATLGLGPTGALGPLVGQYFYRVAFQTARGQTLLGPATGRTANAATPPAVPFVSNSSAAGPLLPGVTYQYAVGYLTPWGEVAPSAGRAVYTPSNLGLGGFAAVSSSGFGGIYGGPYSAGVTIVTRLGETNIFTGFIGSNLFTAAPGNPVYTGVWDTNGRVEPGFTYYWACTAYHDQYGETALSAQTSTTTYTGSGTLRLQIQLPIGSIPANATGLRLWRAVQGRYFNLVAEWAVGSVPSVFWDDFSTGELGGHYPKQSLRAGVRVRYTLNASPEGGVIARRVYRTKAGGGEYFLVGEVADNFQGSVVLDLAPDDQLTQRPPAATQTGRVCVVSGIQLGPGNTTGRRLYRTKGDQGLLYLAADIKDNGTQSWPDSVPDNALTALAPGPTNTVGDEHLLTSIPVGPSGTLARVIYRTKSGGSEYFLLGRLSDNNPGGTFRDNVPDANLGEGAPLVSTAGASAVNITNIPTGPSGVTKRVLYRTTGATGDPATFKYLATIDNNVDTSFLDDKPDDALGRPPSEATNLGALTGDTSLALDTVVGFPSAGWVRADNQYLRYSGITGKSLVGIPPVWPVTSLTRSGDVATIAFAPTLPLSVKDAITVLGADQAEYNGVRTITGGGGGVFQYKVEGFPASPATGTISAAPNGAITAPILGGTIVTTVPMLVGVTGLVRPIKIGARVALWVVRTSSAGVAQLKLLEGGDGIREYAIADDALASIPECQKRGDADLALFQFALVTITYRTLDTHTRSGRTVHVTLPAPYNVDADFLVQSVRISRIGELPRTTPFFDVTLSSTRFSLEDLLRHVVLDV